MRIALDSSILVRAAPRVGGLASELLSKIVNGRHQLILSASIVDEVENSLRYPRLIKRYRLTEAGVEDFIAILRASTQLVEIDRAIVPPIRDAKDIHVLQTAISGNAEYLCTLDRHFYDEVVVEFCAARGLTIISDVDLMRLIRTAATPTQ